jgi:signal transduction histidine kinase
VQLDALTNLAIAVQQQAAQPADLDVLTRSDQEDAVESWLVEQAIENGWEMAPALVEMGYGAVKLAGLARLFERGQLATAVAWLTSTHTIYSLLQEISEGAGRISEIVKALKTYTYLDQAPVQDVDVHEGLDNTLVMLRSKLKKGVTVHRDYCPNLPHIEAYGSELNQVWTNIIDNAVAAMNGQGEISLRTHYEGSWITIEIEDNGPGIPPDVQSKIFDPFFTTKAPGEGTGLGLNISHNIIVQKHHGQITVASQPGRTCFQIKLPVNQAEDGD